MPIAALHSPKPPSLRLSLNSNCVLRASQWISFMWLPVSMNDMLSTNWHASLRSKALGALPRKYGMVYRVARSTNRSHNRSCATISNPAEPHGNRNRGGDSDLGMLRKGGGRCRRPCVTVVPSELSPLTLSKGSGSYPDCRGRF